MSDLVRRVSDIAKLDGPRERLIAVLADLQHGVVATWQLSALGFSSGQIHERVVSGHLHSVYRGVYAVGRRQLTREGRWMAAVLACGENAVLSHSSAIALWGLRPPRGGAIDVTDPTRCRIGHRGIRIHSTRSLDPRDRTLRIGIPVTSVHRAILDFAETAPAQQVRLAIEMADRKEFYNGHLMGELLARTRGRKGIKPLNAVLAAMQGQAATMTRSELEKRLLAGIRERGYPEPHANVLVEGEDVDFVWVKQRLIIEVDSYLWHKTRRDFESNRRRDTKLLLAGYRVMRPTDTRIQYELDEILDEVGRMLAAPPPPPGDP
jgi:very-short-patch-repair endonuclease